MAATDGTHDYEQLADSGEARFHTLDQKLAVAMLPTIKTDNHILATKIQSLEEEEINKGRLIKGRQIVWLIFDHLKLNTHMKLLYSLEDLVNLKYLGDNKVHTFMRFWNVFVSKLDVKLTDAIDNINSKIQGEEGNPPGWQSLTFVS